MVGIYTDRERERERDGQRAGQPDSRVDIAQNQYTQFTFEKEY